MNKKNKFTEDEKMKRVKEHGQMTFIESEYNDDNDNYIFTVDERDNKGNQNKVIKILENNRISMDFLTAECHTILNARLTHDTDIDYDDDLTVFQILNEINTVKTIGLYLQKKGVDIDIINKMEKHFLGKNN